MPSEGTSMSDIFVAKTTVSRACCSAFRAQFAKMYMRKAFTNWYKGKCIDEIEFQEVDYD